MVEVENFGSIRLHVGLAVGRVVNVATVGWLGGVVAAPIRWLVAVAIPVRRLIAIAIPVGWLVAVTVPVGWLVAIAIPVGRSVR